MVLNTTTGFYRHAYEPAMNDHPGAWAVMETILNAVMYAEADPMLTEAQQAFQTRVRPMIGRITSMMCTTLDMSVAQPPPPVAYGPSGRWSKTSRHVSIWTSRRAQRDHRCASNCSRALRPRCAKRS